MTRFIKNQIHWLLWIPLRTMAFYWLHLVNRRYTRTNYLLRIGLRVSTNEKRCPKLSQLQFLSAKLDELNYS